MSDQNPLIVPIQVEALVVNDAVRNSESFQRWQMQYNSIRRWSNAEPAPFSGVDTSFTAPGGTVIYGTTVSAFYNGVYLKWRLPDALRQGVQDSAAGSTTFPLVPNRWLIVRYSGTDLTARQATAWIVESDYVYATAPSQPGNYSQTGSLYINADAPYAITIGRNLALDGQGYSEPGGAAFLTAVSPGNTAFASYQPTNNNVFSFMDPLQGQASMTLSYMVMGWYSDRANDPLAGVVDASRFLEALTSLGWRLPPGTDASAWATRSIYTGSAVAVPWVASGRPAGGPPAASSIAVAVGNTSTEAMTALVGAQAAGSPAVDAALLEAFQMNLLRAYEAPDAAAVLAESMQTSFFQAYAGGYGWDIVDAPGASTVPLSPAELAREDAWLAALNQAQARYDAAARALAALQGQLYVTWWKYQYWPFVYLAGYSEVPFTQADLEAQIDPSVDGSLAAQVVQASKNLTALQQQIPWENPSQGNPQASLTAAVAAYAAAHDLPSTRVLQRYNRPAYHMANDPVLLFSGAGAGGIAVNEGVITTRFSSQVVTGFNYQGTAVTTSSPGLVIPSPNLGATSGVPWTPALLSALVGEFFFLDPTNAATVAKDVLGSVDPGVVTAVGQAMSDPSNDIGVVPDLAPAPTRGNPWRPLYLMWRAYYYPIAYGSAAAPNWTFDGEAYTWNGEGADTRDAPLTLSGRNVLTPQCGLNLQTQIALFLKNDPNLDPREATALTGLSDFIARQDGWDFLSQSLSGFNEQLLLQRVGVYPSPVMSTVSTTPTTAQLIGGAVTYPPGVGNLPSPDSPLTTTFQPWRSGQFVFTNLAVVDEWGQAVFLADDASYPNFKITRPSEMLPTPSVLPQRPDALIQLSPAVLQPGRLDFDLVSCTDDADILGMGSDVDPICGWVLPNHLDRALSIYDNQGTSLGELAVGLDATGGQEVCFRPSPESPYASVAAIAAAIPHFGPFLLALQQQGPTVFAGFLATIDETLWTTQPTGAVFDQNLAVLIGRPLALVRARLQLKLSGPVATDPSWQFTFAPASNPVTGYAFGVELGNLEQINDGLIGYFVGDTYTTFNVVQASGAVEGSYLEPIGEDQNYLYLPFDGQTAIYVSMLVDPRASVHASTGILPVVEVALPPSLVDEALDALTVTFRVGPLAAGSQATTVLGQPGPTAISIPKPAYGGGSWSWLENDDAGWASYAITSPDNAADLPNQPPALRQGLLSLSGALAGEGTGGEGSGGDGQIQRSNATSK